MRQRIPQLRRLLLVLVPFLLLVGAQPLADGEPDQVSTPDQPSGADFAPDYGRQTPEILSGRQDSSDPSRAAHLVQEALSILRALDPPPHRLARSERPSGMFGTVAYYVKEAFYLLFMNGPPQDPLEFRRDHGSLDPPLRKAVKLLKSASDEKNADAMYILAELNFYGNFSHPRNYSEAFRRYHELAALTGNSTAQDMVGFMYATGIGGAVERDQAKALLYHTFAALGGNTKSEMTVAFRHHSGIGTPRNCEKASYYYKKVADKAIEYLRSGPPGGRMIARDAYRLADEEGGVYGEGASVSSAGANAIQGGPNSDTHAALDDVLEYLDLLSRKGDFKATFSLGKLHYEGRRTMKRNPRKAKAYFMLVAKKYWTRDGRVITGSPADVEEYAAKAAAYLGRIFLNGEGTEQSFEKARMWFRRGVANGDAIAQHGLGLLYLEGYGVPKDAVKAASYFKVSADQDFGPAQVNMGALLLDQGDVQTAMRYLELAVRRGNLEGYYYLAEMADQGIGRDRSCGMATTYYKIVAERAEAIHSAFTMANAAHQDGDIETALVLYMMAAEQGYEAGQANAAWLLDEQKSRLPLDSILPHRRSPPSRLGNAALALIYWTRSAKQSNIDSMVKMGDYYLGGIGTEPDDQKAAACYQAAADFQQSAQALWNLGWMHENGVGVEQDFHLAKRFYDQALETNEEAYLPVSLSLLKLRARSFWNTITNGRVNSIRPEPEPRREWSFREWIHNFVQMDEHPYYRDMDVDDDDVTNPLHDTMVGGGGGGGVGGAGGDDFDDDLGVGFGFGWGLGLGLDDGMIESFIIVDWHMRIVTIPTTKTTTSTATISLLSLRLYLRMPNPRSSYKEGEQRQEGREGRGREGREGRGQEYRWKEASKTTKPNIGKKEQKEQKEQKEKKSNKTEASSHAPMTPNMAIYLMVASVSAAVLYLLPESLGGALMNRQRE
ncbi:MAG: ERAD-associated protein [Thelocarpon superellum]|nr:MAG: ERAD-associated protein [Thelocarpon superellum]